jgi:hypothetical protein
MKKILELQHGSHLYGTNTPSSDIDIKGVFIPSARDILLSRVSKTIRPNTKESVGGFTAKNQPGDVDQEFYSLDKYLSLLCEGQTVALDLLFATPILDKSAYDSVWYYQIWLNRERFISRKADSFIGYAYKQASKYGIKGSRVASVRAIVNLLEPLLQNNSHRILGDYREYLVEFVATSGGEFAQLIDIELANQSKIIQHLEVCGRKAPLTISVREAYNMYKRLLDEYGQRALQAENNDGVDWKALSHAVRVGTQSIEYLKTGEMIFPRPDAAHLLDIKKGLLPYKDVAEEIESLIEEIKIASTNSTLPDEPDYKFCEELVVNIYGNEVISTNWA